MKVKLLKNIGIASPVYKKGEMYEIKEGIDKLWEKELWIKFMDDGYYVLEAKVDFTLIH